MKKQLITALLAIAACTGAQAATFTVDTTADLNDATAGDGICGTGAAGTCSLRAAIQEANVLPGADTISLPSGHYTLTRLPLAGNVLGIASDITINGMGVSAGATVIDGNGDRIVLQITGSPTVHLHNLAIVGGTGHGSVFGGGIYIGGGTTTLSQVVVGGNNAAGSVTQQGGGIYVYEFATLNLIDSEVSGNTAVNGGGGISVRVLSTANITRSTVRGNSLTNPGATGGGVDARGTLDLVNSTISGNAAAGGGGGLSVGGGGTANISFTTIANNTSGVNGGQLQVFGATAHIGGSIVANPSAGLNCRLQAGALTSDGYNLDSGTACGFGAAGDIASADPLLGPLTYTSPLPTQTHALQAGSPAVNAGPTGGSLPATDERGAARVQMGRADIGAYESALGAPPGPGNVQAVPVDNPLALVLTALGLLGWARHRKLNPKT
ncbi:hypothetical protein ASE39_21905 [Acidovorax sp. Root267]|uniref:CSLREA domain-containing protein n=1 Tax=Acidovorax sp. Root267 TaxID=1736505 RepID=UPI00070E2124|nr:CSLREA domain-containing protein [Acidovorax sp. Root267]KRD25578.1 hypothetical protein ASE39_21905 [Acidovorax sp. Root267]